MSGDRMTAALAEVRECVLAATAPLLVLPSLTFPHSFLPIQIQALAGAPDRTQKQTAKYKELIGALVQTEDVRGLQVRRRGLEAPPHLLLDAAAATE